MEFPTETTIIRDVTVEDAFISREVSYYGYGNDHAVTWWFEGTAKTADGRTINFSGTIPSNEVKKWEKTADEIIGKRLQSATFWFDGCDPSYIQFVKYVA